VKFRVRIGESGSDQRGFAMIALLALAALIAPSSSQRPQHHQRRNSNERLDRSMIALRQGQGALIAYAAKRAVAGLQGPQTDQPGALPCPDTTIQVRLRESVRALANRVGDCRGRQ